MAAAGEVLPNDADLDDVKDPKKKRFFRLKNIKQLFVRKKRTKSKEDDLKTKSLANVSESLEREDTTDEDGDGGRITGSLSMSHDSVFSSDKTRDGGIGDLTKSMEALPGTGFKNELAAKLGLRPPNFAGGESSSHGKRQRNTIAADVLLENDLRTRGDKSYESDHSVLSMESSENEIEEDFFRDKWASNPSLAHKRTSSPDPGFGSAELDLNVVTTSSGLNISAAKHKIAIAQKGKRASSHLLARRHRTASPKPPGMQTLPEESATTSSKTDITSEDEGLQSTASLESLGSSGKNSPLPIIEPIADYDDEPAPKPVPKASPRVAKKPSIISQKPSLPKASSSSKSEIEEKTSTKDTKVETQQKVVKGSMDNIQKASLHKEDSGGSSVPEFTKVKLKKMVSNDEKSPEKTTAKQPDKAKPGEDIAKTGIKDVNHVKDKNESESKSETKLEQNKSETKKEETKSETKTVVVMRQKSTSTVDSAKRQTIAVLSPSEEKDTSLLGAKRVSKRSSWIEQTAQDKEDDKRTDSTAPQKNEFAQMFSKFQRRASQKKDDSSSTGDKKSVTVLKPVSSTRSADKSGTSPDRTTPGATSPQAVPSPKSPASLSPLTSPSGSQSALSRSPTHNMSPPIANNGSTTSVNTPPNPTVSTDNNKTKSSFTVTKSTSIQPTQDTKAKTVVIEKPKAQESPAQETKASTSPEKKTVEFFAKKTVEEEPSKPSSESKPKTIVITKQMSKSDENKVENDENAQPKSDMKKPASVEFRKPSPIQKDRVRSQTLPEQPVLTQKIANQNAGSDKGSPSPTASPQRSKSMKPTTTAPSDDKPGDGRPSWVAMAKKKTVGWNQDEEEEKTDTKVEKNEEAPPVSSEISSKKSIKDLMSKFQ